jgi:hypothetical protein
MPRTVVTRFVNPADAPDAAAVWLVTAFTVIVDQPEGLRAGRNRGKSLIRTETITHECVYDNEEAAQMGVDEARAAGWDHVALRKMRVWHVHGEGDRFLPPRSPNANRTIVDAGGRRLRMRKNVPVY